MLGFVNRSRLESQQELKKRDRSHQPVLLVYFSKHQVMSVEVNETLATPISPKGKFDVLERKLSSHPSNGREWSLTKKVVIYGWKHNDLPHNCAP